MSALLELLFHEGWQTDWVFVVLAGIMILSALGVVLLRNIIHSALCLIITFLCVAGYYFQLNAEFVALVQIMVYAGAISILIIFAVMLVMDRAPSRTSMPVQNTKKSLISAYGIMLTMAAFGVAGATTKWPHAEVQTNDAVRNLARLYMGDYVIAFEVAAVLLLVAVIGAIILAKGAKDK